MLWGWELPPHNMRTVVLILRTERGQRSLLVLRTESCSIWTSCVTQSMCSRSPLRSGRSLLRPRRLSGAPEVGCVDSDRTSPSIDPARSGDTGSGAAFAAFVAFVAFADALAAAASAAAWAAAAFAAAA